ncbi:MULTISPECIES: hypothetical protein [unclassified Mesorhizobium]|uniref:hypothetical protein n=1 Tax=unclassified Mesorhizobium TaxID=325217 RepID=UPI0011264015|nr:MULTISPECIES: hypothetical protein [unclassified Mesorhizobium]TPK90917.1 hypothetical protein FJ567_29175 [Mesorhizobium sp. B2-4-16]TPL58437.1 hypothetical protein FJ956_29225 [Mesorhizobium sp. B2-4-3]
MILKYCSKSTALILSGLLIFAVPAAVAAESLAGKIGDKRFAPNLSLDPKEACYKAYLAYIAAPGHSAYATTFYSRVVDLYIICGAKLNAPTQKAAEDIALRNCQYGLKKWKVKTASGGCAIAASK